MLALVVLVLATLRPPVVRSRRLVLALPLAVLPFLISMLLFRTDLRRAFWRTLRYSVFRSIRAVRRDSASSVASACEGSVAQTARHVVRAVRLKCADLVFGFLPPGENRAADHYEQQHEREVTNGRVRRRIRTPCRMVLATDAG